VIDSLEIQRRMEIIQDRGPIYNEFVYDSHIHEPWNAFSSLFFFIPVVFWIVFLWGRYKQHRIILLILPLLFLNGLGSTLFHAYRTSNVFLMLDWLPAALMSLSLSVYFWTKITRRWYFGILCVLGFYASAVLVITTLGQGYRVLAPNIGYLFSGSAFLIPIIWSLYRNQWRHARYVLLTLFFLISALIFRLLDYPTPNPFPFLPQGTHFLWHVFSSFAVFTMGYYLYKSGQDALQESQKTTATK